MAGASNKCTAATRRRETSVTVDAHAQRAQQHAEKTFSRAAIQQAAAAARGRRGEEETFLGSASPEAPLAYEPPHTHTHTHTHTDTRGQTRKRRRMIWLGKCYRPPPLPPPLLFVPGASGTGPRAKLAVNTNTANRATSLIPFPACASGTNSQKYST